MQRTGNIKSMDAMRRLHKRMGEFLEKDPIDFSEVTKFQEYPFERLENEDSIYFHDIPYANSGDIDAVLGELSSDLRQIWPEGFRDKDVKQRIIDEYNRRLDIIRDEIEDINRKLSPFKTKIPALPNMYTITIHGFRIVDRADLNEHEREFKKMYEDERSTLMELQREFTSHLRNFQFHDGIARSLRPDEKQSIKKALITLYYMLEKSFEKITIYKHGSSHELFWILFLYRTLYKEPSKREEVLGKVRIAVKGIMGKEFVSEEEFKKDADKVDSHISMILSIIKERANIISEIDLQRTNQNIHDSRIGAKRSSDSPPPI